LLKSLSSDNSEIKNIEDCADSTSISMLNMLTNYGEEKTIAYISLELIRLNDILGLKRPMSKIQIEFVSKECVKYPLNQLKISDIRFSCDKILNGTYGELYESLNPPKILGFFTKHLNSRTEFSSLRNESLSAQHKK